jgi:hypothetical protein
MTLCLKENESCIPPGASRASPCQAKADAFTCTATTFVVTGICLPAVGRDSAVTR